MTEHRYTKQFSDRGSIKDIQKSICGYLEENSNLPPTTEELQIKTSYEHAIMTRDQALLDSLGLIVMNGSVKDPIALHKHREHVNSLKAKFATQLEESKEELSQCLDVQSEIGDNYSAHMEARRTIYKQAMALATVLDDSIVKTASAKGSLDNTFRRVK